MSKIAVGHDVIQYPLLEVLWQKILLEFQEGKNAFPKDCFLFSGKIYVTWSVSFFPLYLESQSKADVSIYVYV